MQQTEPRRLTITRSPEQYAVVKDAHEMYCTPFRTELRCTTAWWSVARYQPLPTHTTIDQLTTFSRTLDGLQANERGIQLA